MNKSLLKYQMQLHNDSVKDLAEFLNVHFTTLYKKINGVNDFSNTEMSKIAKRYNLADAEVVDIFLL